MATASEKHASAAPVVRPFQLKKLHAVLWISVIGMAVALVWHGVMGWGLGRSYPYNTFLFPPKVRYTDFYVIRDAAVSADPYKTASYPPFAFILVRLFQFLPQHAAVLTFSGLSTLGLGVLLYFSLKSIVPQGWLRLLYTLALLATCYPLICCVDRGNLEVFMALMVGLAVACFQRRRWAMGSGWLLPAICLKFYPVALVCVLIRRRQFPWIVALGIAAGLVTYACLASFPGSPAANFRNWTQATSDFKKPYIYYNIALASAASPWNACKIIVSAAAYFTSSKYHEKRGVPMMNLLGDSYAIYTYCLYALGLITVLYIVLVERELARRMILLLIYMTIAAPGGADYHMLYGCVALVVLIKLKGERRHDFLATVLLALAFIPKREILLPYYYGGQNPGEINGASVSVFLTPLLLLWSYAAFLRDGWSLRRPGDAWHRLHGLLNWRHLPLFAAARGGPGRG